MSYGDVLHIFYEFLDMGNSNYAYIHSSFRKWGYTQIIYFYIFNSGFVHGEATILGYDLENL